MRRRDAVVLAVAGIVPVVLIVAGLLTAPDEPADDEPTVLGIADEATLRVEPRIAGAGRLPDVPRLPPSGALALEAVLCSRPGAAVDEALAVRLWVLRDRWTPIDVDWAWRVDGACRRGAIERPVAALWPDDRPGVRRWIAVAGAGTDVLPGKGEPAPIWRERGMLVVDGEVVVSLEP